MKIDFEFETPHGVFRDAIVLPDDHSFTASELQLMKEKRVDDWIAAVTAVPEGE
jgi:hypothetical protein